MKRTKKLVVILALTAGAAACATNTPRFEGPLPVAAATDTDTRIDGDTRRYNGFDGELPRIGSAVALDVRVSENLAYLAENDGPLRGSSRLNDGFSSGGQLGTQSVGELVLETEEELVRALSKRGVAIDANAPVVLQVVLTDAAPNRPTFEQLSSEPSLSFNSFGRGGVSAEGRLVEAGGSELGGFTYGYYTDFIENAPFRATWTDANRGIERMAKNVAKRLG